MSVLNFFVFVGFNLNSEAKQSFLIKNVLAKLMGRIDVMHLREAD